MSVLRTRTVGASIADTEGEVDSEGLRRTLGPLQLTVFGIGVVIGTGIFVLTDKAAGVQAGAVALSFVVAGIGCALAALAALCYAELASSGVHEVARAEAAAGR